MTIVLRRGDEKMSNQNEAQQTCKENQKIFLQYIEQANQRQNEVFSFCEDLVEKGYTEIRMEEIPTFQILAYAYFFEFMIEEKSDRETWKEKLLSKGVPVNWLLMYSSPSIAGSSPSMYLLYDGDNERQKTHYAVSFREDYFRYFEVPYVQECYFNFIREIQEFYLKTEIEYQKWLCEKSGGKQKTIHTSKEK